MNKLYLFSQCCPSVFGSRNRRGLTLIELVTVIAIVTILMGLALPGILAIRENSRRMSCQSNLRQIGSMAHEYHAMHKHLPNDGFLRPMLNQIDPNLENAYKSYPSETPPPFPSELSPPSIYYCPSENYVPWDLGSRFSYRRNHGNLLGPREQGNSSNGVVRGRPGSPLKFSEVTDGLSNTALTAETLFRIHPSSTVDRQQHPMRYSHALQRDYRNGQEDELLADARRIKASGDLRGSGRTGESLGIGMRSSTELFYNHVGPPNEWSFAAPGVETHARPGMQPPSSFHVGGVNIVFLDTSVHFMPDSIDMQVWRAIGSIDGNEPVAFTVP